MIECPVCRSPVLGRPATCGSCGTPLQGATGRRLPVVISFILPGLAHFILGYPLLGSLVVFGSFFLGLYLIFSILVFTVSLPGLVLAGLLWFSWAAGWGVHTVYLRRRYFNGDFLLFYLVGLLILANITAFLYWIISLLFFI